MVIDERVAALARLPHFRGVEPSVLRELARDASPRTLGRGEWLFRQGDPADAFHVVQRGSVRLFRMSPSGHEQTLHRVKAGRSFAEAAALTMPTYPANASALIDGTVVLCVPSKSLRRTFDDGGVARAVVASLSAHLLHLVGRVEDLSIGSASARLARHLLALPSRTLDDGDIEIPLPTSKRELAEHLGMTPETLSRMLRKWTDGGTIHSERRSVVVRDVEGLLGLADEA